MKRTFRLSLLLFAVGLVPLVFGCSREPKPGQVIKVQGVDMVYVPGGAFTMGDRSTGQFQVTLEQYLIDRTEVTNAQFREFAKTFSVPFPVPPSYDELPVINVSWETASAFAAWRGCRLPSEAEWEFAARGTDGRTYPWGDKSDLTKGNADDGVDVMSRPDGSQDGFASLAPIGMFSQGASPFGALDMAGNVWEWVEDWFAPYPDSAVSDYQGPETGERKVRRGGSYTSSIFNHRTFHRAYLLPVSYAEDVGFRCACDYPPPERGAVPRREAGRADTTK